MNIHEHSVPRQIIENTTIRRKTLIFPVQYLAVTTIINNWVHLVCLPPASQLISSVFATKEAIKVHIQTHPQSEGLIGVLHETQELP